MKKSFAMMLTAALTTTSVCGFAFADEAANDPYGKYDELVTYTTGYSLTNQGADVLAGTPYENDTPENNAYTRYLKELLNIQNENDFEATMGDDYNQKLALAIASQSLPDIIHVPDYSTLVELVENDMIEDLTDVYNNSACDTVKESYESYGDNNPLNTVTFDGKIMAIPKTQLSDGQDFLWVRRIGLISLALKSLQQWMKLLICFVRLSMMIQMEMERLIPSVLQCVLTYMANILITHLELIIFSLHLVHIQASGLLQRMEQLYMVQFRKR